MISKQDSIDFSPPFTDLFHDPDRPSQSNENTSDTTTDCIDALLPSSSSFSDLKLDLLSPHFDLDLADWKSVFDKPPAQNLNALAEAASGIISPPASSRSGTSSPADALPQSSPDHSSVLDDLDFESLFGESAADTETESSSNNNSNNTFTLASFPPLSKKRKLSFHTLPPPKRALPYSKPLPFHPTYPTPPSSSSPSNSATPPLLLPNDVKNSTPNLSAIASLKQQMVSAHTLLTTYTALKKSSAQLATQLEQSTQYRSLLAHENSRLRSSAAILAREKDQLKRALHRLHKDTNGLKKNEALLHEIHEKNIEIQRLRRKYEPKGSTPDAPQTSSKAAAALLVAHSDYRKA